MCDVLSYPPSPSQTLCVAPCLIPLLLRRHCVWCLVYFSFPSPLQTLCVVFVYFSVPSPLQSVMSGLLLLHRHCVCTWCLVYFSFPSSQTLRLCGVLSYTPALSQTLCVMSCVLLLLLHSVCDVLSYSPSTSNSRKQNEVRISCLTDIVCGILSSSSSSNILKQNEAVPVSHIFCVVSFLHHLL